MCGGLYCGLLSRSISFSRENRRGTIQHSAGLVAVSDLFFRDHCLSIQPNLLPKRVSICDSPDNEESLVAVSKYDACDGKCCVCPGIGIDICHLRNRCRGETYGNWRSAADGVEWIRPFGAEWIRTLERDDIHDGTGFAGAWRAAIRGVDEWKCASWNVCIGSSFGEFGVLDASAASGKLSDAS